MSSPTWQHPVSGERRQSGKQPNALVEGKLIPWLPVDADGVPAATGDADLQATLNSLVGLPPGPDPQGSGFVDPDDPDAPEMVPVPPRSASKAEMVEFVLATTDYDRAEVEAMTKAQIVERYGL